MKSKHPHHSQGMWKGAPPEAFSKAQKLRKNLTKSEKLLWEKLSKNQFHGFKFRRQHPIHIFIADFYCHKLKLIIEIDGEYHENEKQKLLDEQRTELLEKQGLKIIRFTNEEIASNIEEVIKKLESYLPSN